jgi:hypothetical protein
MQWTVFDLEFNALLPEPGQPWPESLHITCGSIFSTCDLWPNVWYEAHSDNLDAEGLFMSEKTVRAFVEALECMASKGHTLVTWGGSATDWRMLAKECPDKSETIRSLALNSVDVPMCSCMSIGMMMGLNAACMAIGLDLKDSEASSKVPDMWLQADQRQKVLQHVSNDSYATMQIVLRATLTKELPWITKKGHMKTWSPVVLATVRQCLAKELPKVPFEIGPNHNAKLLARWLLLPS